MRSYFGQGFEKSGPPSYFYTRDHLGSVREVVGSDGTTVASRLSYDLWGKSTESGSGALSDFTYTGHHYDRATGLNLAQYRAYASSLGRWISRDPIGIDGGLNLYGYADNNPVRYIDPSGWIPMDGATTDRSIGSPQDWSDLNFQSGLKWGGIAGAALDVAVIGSFLVGEAVAAWLTTSPTVATVTGSGTVAAMERARAACPNGDCDLLSKLMRNDIGGKLITLQARAGGPLPTVGNLPKNWAFHTDLINADGTVSDPLLKLTWASVDAFRQGIIGNAQNINTIIDGVCQ